MILAILGGLHHGWRNRDTFIERVPFLARMWPGPPPVVPAPGVISMGHWHIVALHGDGGIFGWGENQKKELGLAQASHMPVPKQLAPARSWRYLATGNNAAYAITDEGQLWRREFQAHARGYGNELTDQPIEYHPLFPDKRWKKVLESQGRAAGLDSEGRLWSWEESLLEYPRILIVESEPQVQLNLRQDGTILIESAEELDRKAAEELAGSQAMLEQMKADWTRQYMPTQPGYLDTPAGRAVLDKMKAMVGTSMEERRQRLEDIKQAKIAATGGIDFPAPVTPNRGWVDFCVDRVIDGINGPGRIYAIDRDGGLWKSGEPIPTRPVPDILRFEMSQVPVAARLTRVFCRENAGTVLAIDDQGLLWGFGSNASGRLGNGDGRVYGENKSIPESEMKQLNNKRWVDIAPGITATFGITRDGQLWGWGANHDGALGTGDDDSHHDVPTLIDSTHTWVAVTAGYESAAALTRTGQLYTWGKNGAGVLGEGGSTETRRRPGLTEGAGGWWTQNPGITSE